MASLPQPNAEALAHSARLEQVIRDRITVAGGAINFSEFMQMAMYEPGLGYYVSGNHKIGAAGDFITAPEISCLFSQALAKQCQQVLQQIDQASILEFGAGSGVMAADILSFLAKQHCLPERYCILEISPELRARQEATLREKVPTLIDKVEWLNTLPENFKGVVLANEVLDAMPVERFTFADGNFLQQQVMDDKGFVTTNQTITQERLRIPLAHLQDEGVDFTEGQIGEMNLNIQPWLNSLSDSVQQAVVLLIDYGHSRHEYYHSHYQQGSLRCFYQHQVHDDVFRYIGLQDITAHVDFTAVAEAALNADLQVLDFASQAVFLVNNGILELAKNEAIDEVDRFNQQQQLKQLILPSEMGELFKVLALGKNIDFDLQGFSSNSALRNL